MNQEQLHRAFDLAWQATVSQEYFRALEWRWNVTYVIANVLVALLTAIGVYASRKPKLLGQLSNRVAAISLFLAFITFIIPSGRWAQQYRDFAQEWTAIRTKSETLERQIKNNEIDQQTAAFALASIGEQAATIVGKEPGTWQGLLIECWGNQAERVYGAGIRTPEQVEARLREMGIEPVKPPPMFPPGTAQAAR